MSASPSKRIFLSYSRTDESVSERIARVLREAGIEVFRDKDSLLLGQFWSEDLEQALRETDGMVVCCGPTGLGNWQKREVSVAFERKNREPSFPLIPIWLPGSTDQPLGFLNSLTSLDLRQGIGDAESLRKLVRALFGEPPVAGDKRPDPHNIVCPYRGLETFREEDAPFFFGREDLIRQLITKVKKTPITVLLGPSGSGKSSLVQAGLLPTLYIDAGAIWHVIALRPGSEPLLALAAAFDPPPLNAGPTERLAYLNKAAARLRQKEVHFCQLAEAFVLKLPLKGRVLLVIDQWEELYTQANRSGGVINDIALFVSLLIEAAKVSSFHSLWVLRTDFYDEASRRPGMAQILAEHQVPVSAIQRDGLARVITGPAKAVGINLEHGLLDRILDDVGTEPGNLPLLEHALHELWLQRRDNLLTFEAYQAIGGIRLAIATRARQTYSLLNQVQQTAARRLFVSLVAPIEGRDDVRVRLPLPKEPELLEVIRRFAAQDVRLLVTGAATGSRQGTVEFSHEALIRNWEELRQWVDERRDALRIRERIKADRLAWEAQHRHTDLLLSQGIRLEEGRWLLTQRQNLIIDEIRPYIEASLRHVVRIKRRNIMVVALFVVLLTAIAGTLYSLRERALSELTRAVETDSRRLAQIAQRYLDAGAPHRSIMVAREAFGPLQENLHLSQRPYVWQAADVLHRALTARPILRKVFRGHTYVVNRAIFSPDGRHIATAATDGRVFILDARTLDVERLIIPSPATFSESSHSDDENVGDIDFSPDGTRLATASTDGFVRLFNVTDGKLVLQFQVFAKSYLWFSLSFTPDGTMLVTTSNDSVGSKMQKHQAQLWNAKDGRLVRTIFGTKDCCVNSGVVSPEGTRLAIAEENSISLWNIQTGERLLRLGGSKSFPSIQSLAFSPDGTRIVAGGYGDNLVHIWDINTETELFTLRGHADDVSSVAFSPDGRHLVTSECCSSAKTLIWDMATGRQTAVLFDPGQYQGGRSAVFSPDGRFIVTSGQDRTVRLWEFAPPEPVSELRAEGNLRSFTFSPDGKLIVATSNEGTWVWQTELEKAVNLGNAEDEPHSAVDFSPDSSRMLVTGNRNSEAALFDLNSFNKLRTFSPVRSLFGDGPPARFSPDGSKIVAISEEEHRSEMAMDFINNTKVSTGMVARLWNTENGKPLAVLGPHPNFHDLAFVGKGDRVMTLGGSFIRFWGASSGSKLSEIRVRDGDTGVVQAVASPDGSLVAAGDAWIRAKVWNVRNGKPVTELKEARENTFVHQFTPDGKFIVASDDMGILGLWEPKTGRRTRTINWPGTALSAFGLSKSGDRIMAAGKDLTVRVWETETGKLLFLTDLSLYRIHGPGAMVWTEAQYGHAVLHPSGNQVLTQLVDQAGGNQPGLVFDLPYQNFEEVVAAAYAAVPYRFTEDERAELEFDLFGRPDPRADSLEALTVKQK